MSSYPPGGGYDERLLHYAPTDLREGYNVDPLANGSSDSPANARNQATAEGHARIEALSPPSKEGYTPYSVPRFLQKKWQIALLVGAIFFIGAVVGGVVGGTIGHKKNNGTPSTASGPHIPSTASLPFNSPPTSSIGLSQTDGPRVSSSTFLPQTTPRADGGTSLSP